MIRDMLKAIRSCIEFMYYMTPLGRWSDPVRHAMLRDAWANLDKPKHPLEDITEPR